MFGVASDKSTDDWYTPSWLFDIMDVRFDLDVAAPPGGVDWIPADRYYTAADDGLAQPWKGFVWCNPPYSAPYQWALKWAAHGDGLILLRADMSTGGPFAAFAAASSLFVPKGRLRFVNGFGGSTSSTTFSTVLLGVGKTADAAIARLGLLTDGVSRKLGVQPHRMVFSDER